MRETLDIENLKEFIEQNYETKAQFSRELGISYSHLDSLLKGKVTLGKKTKEKLIKLLNSTDFNIEDFIVPKDMVIGNQKVKLINVSLDDELLCSISSRDIIEKGNIKVDFIV